MKCEEDFRGMREGMGDRGCGVLVWHVSFLFWSPPFFLSFQLPLFIRFNLPLVMYLLLAGFLFFSFLFLFCRLGFGKLRRGRVGLKGRRGSFGRISRMWISWLREWILGILDVEGGHRGLYSCWFVYCNVVVWRACLVIETRLVGI